MGKNFMDSVVSKLNCNIILAKGYLAIHALIEFVYIMDQQPNWK